jgi:hypothetical protein
MRMIPLFIAVFAILTLGQATPLFAQSTDTKRIEKTRQVKEKIGKLGTGRSAVVKLKLYNDTEYKGYVARGGDDDFDVIDTAGGSHTVRYDDVRSIGGKNMSTGAKIAIGVGIGAGAMILIIFISLAHLD